MSQRDRKNTNKLLYRAPAADFEKIPGNPIAYWFSKEAVSISEKNPTLSSISEAKSGMSSCNSELFLRMWFEVSSSDLNRVACSHDDAMNSGSRWFPYNKGGGNKRWYGYNETVINWKNEGQDIKQFVVNNPKDPNTTHWSRRLFNLDYFFCPGITWSAVASGSFSCREVNIGIIPGTGSKTLYGLDGQEKLILAFLNSKVASYYLSVFSPTLNFEAGDVGKIPVMMSVDKDKIKSSNLVEIAKLDWDSYEESWGFSKLHLLNFDLPIQSLKLTYRKLRLKWHDMTQEMQRLEEENNRLFLDAYGLQDELTPEISLSEITLTCNPYYRYSANLTDHEREKRLQSDTLSELISYAIGCMMGRFSLDREGLVYARSSNEGFNTLVEEGAFTRFPADSDGILPLTSEAWFEDDVAAQVVEFVRTVWGIEHLEENLQFIADSLCLAAIKPVKKGGETSRETIRRYLSTQFFKDHLKTYKKRPIYWLFSSGKEKAFECLVYLHRYNETTLPRMRTEYVTPLLGQMDSRIDRLRLQQNEAETAEAKRIGKEIDSLTKQITELRSFDDQLKHYADMKIQLDLDDGVKINYAKFGTLLAEAKAITGDKAE
ncbi:BREX-1 system adenine-specific DNA-methyltransferase PglX [Citrobacter sedlakii]|uniref:BREX-1 system adenine-specific DNA-methyltransferase PglX n=1 Tax=Citrobacter TaxID=544 RepID=UPI001969FF8A|nr:MULTISPECIES: BREX-1 system adenine-specific DNA-methyltransferase PglX [Citrobacter]MBM9568546.1 BREX-1 system adenine-specific DNA-methyltransferase PglX [Citrobacter sedlakii]HBL4689993.1 BREX-1 system adenine-specific DNA-methyltransferase PglX [Citrobacter sedlakii]HBL4704432.1 BREX-1 system adenine-specific DNA-methyltransferase PglX [Citrobacter sedlakii]HBL4719181.1 BREX-1 system adenine-specific DNA-methyltransferase PglX [Citrobacter sedlakii]HCA7840133.1 BREX-1 system adenine-spe